MNKRRLSVILILSMVINMTMPHAAVFANEVEKTSGTSQSKIAEQLKADLGEDRADEIMGVTKKSVEYTKTSYGTNYSDNNSDEHDKNLDGNIVDPEIEDVENENGTDYVNEPEDDGEPESSEPSSEGETANSNSENEGGEENSDQTTDSINESINNESTSVSKGESTDESTSESTNVYVDESTSEVNSQDQGNSNENNFKNEKIASESYIETHVEDETLEEVQLATVSEPIGFDGDKLLGASEYTCYWYIDDSDSNNITIHYSSTEPSNYSSLADDKKGMKILEGEDGPCLDDDNQYITRIKTAIFDNAVYAKACGSWFRGFTALTEIQNLSYLNVDDTAHFESMFYDCHSLTSLDLSNFNMSRAYWMSEMFYNCRSLTSLDLSRFSTSGVYSMSEMFYGCSSLTNLDLSSFNTENVWYMEKMFYGCSSLETLNISSFSTNNVEADQIFYNCSSLRTIYALKSFDFRPNYDVSVFEGCTSLVGGNGTAYSSQHVDGEYARVDAIGAPGYFTLYGSSETPSLDSIEIISNPKLLYGVGQKFNPDKMKLRLKQ